MTFTFRNNCPAGDRLAGDADLQRPRVPDHRLRPGAGPSVSFPGVGATWSGRVWGRYRCTATPPGARFSCESGDCGTGQVACGGAGGAPPATLAEFTLGGGASDF